MSSDPHLEVHVSIQKGFSMPPLHKCSNCCFPGKFHCPFCLPSYFKPAKHSRARIHLNKHLKRAIYVGEYTIHRCGLACRNQPHYHCLYCTATLIRRRDFINHLPICHRLQQRRAQKLSQLHAAATLRGRRKGLIAPPPTPGEGDNPSYDIESRDDSNNESTDDSNDDSDEAPIILDSDDQNSQGESSRQLVAPIIECDTESPKSHQTVQTNIEKPQDCDEYYFMSLVKMFKKLSPQKKAEVRMKIERILFEAEFE